MVEVFITNVCDPLTAAHILRELHATCLLYVANFDLEDQDHVLRVKALVGDVDAALVISLLHTHGHTAEIMSDEIPQFSFGY